MSKLTAALDVIKKVEKPAKLSKSDVERLVSLQDFVNTVAPFLRRLQKPRYDEYETDEYVNGSTDCERALKAMADYDGAN